MRLTADLGAADPDFDFAGYGVRNLGYVMLVETAASIRVYVRPLLVGDRTMDALRRCLARRHSGRAALSYFDDAWHHEIFGDTAALQQRLAELLESAAKPATERFVATRRDMAGLLANENDPFATLLRHWLDGTPPEDPYGFLVANGIEDRAWIAEREEGGKHFLFRHVGSGIEIYDTSWHIAALGRAVGDQPDRHYGEWIERTCESLSERQSARYELVVAEVARPGGMTNQWRYHRLMLPWRPRGRWLVMAVTRRDQAERRCG
jgi:hypothetical protein